MTISQFVSFLQKDSFWLIFGNDFFNGGTHTLVRKKLLHSCSTL